ncbi:MULTISPECIES: ester cyclase [unclassified Mycobacterium]|uniref:ester cyclase n=1 Tax=unclassified Mycobacterium TaxID=2642494 RepID=UPI0029C70ED9|nr:MULTISPECIES: ester cyclase [unclassified Mycobacterium]
MFAQSSPITDAKDVCVRSIHLMETAELADFGDVVHPEAVNRESAAEPTAARGAGPAAFHATALWLRSAFSELTWDVHEAVQDGNLVVVHATMRGRQTGPFVSYGPDARPVMAFPPRGRSFAVTQTHWFRMAEGKVIEHWANRDDLGMGQQLGWTPPSPVYLVRMLLARRRARSQRS